MAAKFGSRTTITVPEISERLGICEDLIYGLLRSKAIPNIRYGRKYIVSRAAFEHWERTIGEESHTAPKVA
jgi:excisionase family DNA binding protein